MGNQYDIIIEQGSSFSLNLTASDPSGNPLNLSGYVASGLLRYSFGSTGILANLGASIAGDGTSGVIILSLPPEATMNLPVTKAVYDVEVYNSGNDYSFRPVRGYADICPSVSF